MKIPKNNICLFAAMGIAPFVSAQSWQEVETFPNGTPTQTWNTVGQLSLDTSSGALKAKLAEGANGTATTVVTLPTSYSTGKFTIAFDFFLPSGELENQAGFGVGSASQLNLSGWGQVGNRNRFQMVSDYPQNMAKVPVWASDIFSDGSENSGTEQGTWYNVWLVYDLDASPKTVTAVTKEASAPMLPENLISNKFDFDGSNNDDWSNISHFGVGVGSLEKVPAGKTTSDSLGLLIDNIALSDGENITVTPWTKNPTWEVVDTFDCASATASWTVDSGMTVDFAGDTALFAAASSTTYKGAYVDLPMAVEQGNMTLTFDFAIPGDGLSWALFGVVGDEQVAGTNDVRFGGSDRYVVYGPNSPQSLTKWGDFNSNLLGTTVLDQWYHAWIVYEVNGSMSFYSAPFGSANPPSEPTKTYKLATNYSALTKFIVGSQLGGHKGIKIDNIYQAEGELITFSPTAGQLEHCDSGTFEGWDAVGEWKDYDIPLTGWVYAYNSLWGYSTFLGYVAATSPDWVFQLNVGYIYPVAESNGTYIFYSPSRGWIYAKDSDDGWYQYLDNGWKWDNFITPQN